VGTPTGSRVETGSTPAAEAGKSEPSRLRALAAKPGTLSFAILVAILAAWEGGGRSGVLDTFFFSTPTEIAEKAWELLLNGSLLFHSLRTGFAYFVGVIAAISLGATCGLAMGWWRRFGDVVDPYVVFFSAMPRIALFPIIILIFGIGDVSRTVIVFLGVVFPVLFNAYIGAKQTPRLLIDVGRVFGYSHNRLFTAVVLPAALPYLIAGFRIGVTLGIIMIVVAEFLAASAGLGQQIAVTAQSYQIAEMWAWVLYTSFYALIIVRGMDYFERWAMRWA
jgi:NitT/TauT family transport system permease protein